MNLVPIFDNDFLILIEHEQIASPTATCHYQRYNDIRKVENKLLENSENIQCILARPDTFSKLNTIPFGQSQQPKLWDYADGVDTMEWLAGV